MKVVQAAEVLRKGFIQLTGDANVVTVDDKTAEQLNISELVSYGNDWLSNTANGDDRYNTMYKQLVDQIGYIIYQNRIYNQMNRGLIKEYQTYGRAIEKIYYPPIQPRENPSWKKEYDDATDNPFLIYDNQIKVKIFSRMTTWEVPYTVDPEYTLNSAFQNETEIVKFLSGLYTAADNSMEMLLEESGNIVRTAFMAQKILYQNTAGANGIHVIQLGTNYNASLPAGATQLTTIDERLSSLDFLQYAVIQMARIYNQMSRANTIYNTEQFVRFSQDGEKSMELLSDFANAINYRLRSNTFHEQFMKLPTYNEVPYWQGLGEDGSFNQVSSINVTVEDLTKMGVADAQEGIELSNIVGIIHDVDAMGVTSFNRRTTSQYNGHNEKSNYWLKADVGMFADMSEQGVIFTLN